MPKKLDSRGMAVAALFLAAVLWSTGGLGFRLLTIQNGLAVSGYRSLFAAIFYIVAFKSLPKMESSRWFKIAILAYACTTTLFAVANTLTTAANAIVLQYTAPIFTCVFLFLIYKKPLPKHDIIAAILIFTGIGVFFLDSMTLQANPAMTLGNAIAVGSGLGFGLQAVVIGLAAVPRNVFTFGNIFNVLVTLPFIFLNPITTFVDLGVLVYLGVVQIGVAYLLFSFAVPKVTPLELILIPALEPILNPIWVFLFDGQAPSFLSMGAGAVIIFTILIWSLYKEKFVARNDNARLGEEA